MKRKIILAAILSLITIAPQLVAMYNAIQDNNIKLVEEILEKDQYKVHEDVNCPLHIAAEKGYTEIIELLVNKDADVESKDQWGKTPLHWAVLKGRTKIVEFLLSKGANIDSTDKFDNTSLHIAAYYGKKIVTLLLSKGANLKAQNEHDETAFDLAKQNGHKEIVTLLTQAKKLAKLFNHLQTNKYKNTIAKMDHLFLDKETLE